MGKYTDGKAWLAALHVKQAGQPIEGEPQSGEHTIALKPGLELHGDREAVPQQLAATFPNCTFTWEK